MAERRKQTHVVSLVDDVMLRLLFEFHILTAKQVTSLRYSARSITYVREHLKRLSEAGFLQRSYLPHLAAQGRSESVYELAVAGLHYLADLGFVVRGRPRPAERLYGGQFLLHTLAGNQVLIGARRLELQYPQIRVAQIRHERDLKRVAGVSIETGAKECEKVFVVPDGWIDFRVSRPNGRERQVPLWLEIDRDTEAVGAIKRKVRGIVRYVDRGHYARVFGTTSLRVGFLVDQSVHTRSSESEKRRKALVRWIAEELTSLGKQEFRHAFACALLPPVEEFDPTTLFLKPVWSVPATALPISLLDLPQSRSGDLRNGQSTLL